MMQQSNFGIEPEDIISMANDHELATSDLRERMDDDYELYRLDAFDGIMEDMTPEQMQNEKGYRHYTSNEPRTFANKIMSWISRSEVIIKVPNELSTIPDRRVNDAKERFAIGILRRANERLERLMRPSLQDQMGFYACVRGYIFGRSFMYLNRQNQLVVDITPFDPRNVSWAMGDDGPLWVVHKTRKTRSQILSEYGVDVGEGDVGDADGQGVEIYDYYDGRFNAVVREGEWLKQPTPHFSRRIPVFYAAVGPTPMVMTGDINTHPEDYGESIFAPNRNIYDSNNFLFSVMLELAARTRKPGTKIFSPDGSMTMEGDVHQEGAEVSLRTGLEDITLLEQPEIGNTFVNLLQLIASEREKGGISSVNFGSTPFSLSGFAINSLRDQDSSALMHPLRAVESCMLQAINLITDQYSSGIFPAIQVSGRTTGREYFRESIRPQDVAMGGDYTLQLVPQLPEDDAAKFAQAQIARDAPNGVPLLPDSWIWEKILSIQDADNLGDTINEELAGRFSPMAQMHEMLRAVINRGRPDLAQIVQGQMMVAMIQQLMMTGVIPPPAPAPTGPEAHSPGANAQNGTQRRLDPRQGGNPALGAEPPAPTPQGGPLVPPGTPRPGAQESPTVQLNSIGLFGPDQ